MEELSVLKKEYAELDAFSSPENFQDLFNLGKMFAASSLVPSNFQGKPMDCAIAVDMARRAGLSPMMVMQNLYVVRGKPAWSGQACMALIRACPELENVRVIYTGEKSTDTWGCYISAVDKKTEAICKGPEVTIGMAKAEEWYSKKDKYGKETSKWITMPELMLAYRAASFFARIYVPNALMGFRIEGEIEDIAKHTAQPIDPFSSNDKEL